jgi:hypothetical protein
MSTKNAGQCQLSVSRLTLAALMIAFAQFQERTREPFGKMNALPDIYEPKSEWCINNLPECKLLSGQN